MVLGRLIIPCYQLFIYRTFTFYGSIFQSTSTKLVIELETDTSRQLIPVSLVQQRVSSYIAQVFGSSHFAHHYLGNHIRFLFLALLRCFSSRRSPLYLIYSDKDSWITPRESPHSEILGSKPGWRFPEAYSSLPLLSSPSDAKASTKCPFQLSTNFSFIICLMINPLIFSIIYFKDQRF